MPEQCLDHFLGKAFEQECAGPFFPLSWASNLEISCEGKSRPRLHLRQDFAQAYLLEDEQESLAPEFDRVTEDGIRFCLYRIGCLEVRTITGPDCGPVARRSPAEFVHLRHRPPRDEAPTVRGRSCARSEFSWTASWCRIAGSRAAS